MSAASNPGPASNTLSSSSNPPPPFARRWVSYLLAFGVSVAIGLAPLLGNASVPLFSPLLNLIPNSLRGSLIPVMSAMMGVLAVGVQWLGEEKLSKRIARRIFAGLLFSALVSLYAFFTIATFIVVPVDEGGPTDRGTVSFLVAFSRPNKVPCTEDLSDAECIERLTFDQSRVTSFWGNGPVRTAQIFLTTPYMLFMLSFGAMVGVMMAPRGD